MAVAITKCLIDWGLDKVFTITVDNASSNDTTAKELSKQFSKWGTNFMDGSHIHVRCVAHIINLIVQDGLKKVGDPVKRVGQATRYIRQSPARIKRFKECCEIEKIESKKSLCLDVPTRWNSTYLMLNTTQEFENALQDMVLLILDCWIIFLIIIVKMESSLHFENAMDSDDLDLIFMAERMKAKFEKYWGVPEKMNKMIFVACVLDPRFKFEYVAFVLLSMYGEEKGGK
ncbi:zinc finger BED domain-containing protein RICESLEEPER 2-like [Henckelia pumila]|uniref:zinc finger BED domain-containing protein RICESLEEPER 2-like n=1 Tax=Henckelia pumila TaxID=405737 RepID=UPI003C6E6BA7